MSPTELIQRMTAEGVTLQVTSTGTLKAIGEQTAIDRWLPILKARKPDLVAALTQLPDDLERRVRSMAHRWRYSSEELDDVLDRARRDPTAWARAVALDERREAMFREQGLLPKADA